MFTRARFYLGLQIVGALALCIIGIGYTASLINPLFVLAGVAALALAMIILRNPVGGVLLFVFCIPFERIGSYDIAGITLRPSQVTAALAIISLFFYFARHRQARLASNPTLIPLALFSIVSIVGVLQAPNLQRSLMVAAFTLFTFGISVMIPLVITSEQRVRQLLNYLFASFVLVTLFGIYQCVGDLAGLPPELTGLRELYTKEILGFPRVQSTALEPLYFANYLLIPLSILISLFFSSAKSIPTPRLVALIGLGIINMVLTVARGGYIAFAVSVCILLVYYFFQLELLRRRTIIYGILSVVVVGIIVTRFLNIATVSDKFFGHVSNLFTGASYVERVETFGYAVRAWQEHPLIGIGPGSFGPYTSIHPYAIPEHGWRIVNNQYLELLAEHGLLGLLSMLSIFLVVIIRSIKALLYTQNRYLHAVLLGLLAGFIGILVQYNTFSTLYIAHIWFTIGLLVALQNTIFNSKKQ